MNTTIPTIIYGNKEDLPQNKAQNYLLEKAIIKKVKEYNDNVYLNAEIKAKLNKIDNTKRLSKLSKLDGKGIIFNLLSNKRLKFYYLIDPIAKNNTKDVSLSEVKRISGDRQFRKRNKKAREFRNKHRD